MCDILAWLETDLALTRTSLSSLVAEVREERRADDAPTSRATKLSLPGASRVDRGMNVRATLRACHVGVRPNRQAAVGKKN